MKISKIHISKYHQFEDFELDLTYPKGHEKEGQPLDKVCFIGQSGTGKTTLLEMIGTAILMANPTAPINNFKLENGHGVRVHFNSEDDSFTMILLSGGQASMEKHLNIPIVLNLLYFPAGIAIFNIKNKGSENNVDVVEEPHEEYKTKATVNAHIFNNDVLEKIWQEYYEKIKNYKKESINVRLKFFEEVEGQKKFKKWKEGNPNPTEKTASECLDILLNKFNLMVKTEIDDAGEKDILPIKSLYDNTIIPYEELSTGTKQIIYTAFPLYQMLQEEQESIILMDEPENSLYPDIQKEIIDYYTSFDKEKKSQFFFATHSPIIASSFEPWEIVELKFDEKGKVYRDIYYEGENHVDNYRLDPQILRYDQILTRIFDLSRGSDIKRSKKMQELAILENKVRGLSEEEREKPSQENEKLIEQYLRLKNDLSGTWALTKHEKN